MATSRQRTPVASTSRRAVMQVPDATKTRPHRWKGQRDLDRRANRLSDDSPPRRSSQDSSSREPDGWPRRTRSSRACSRIPSPSRRTRPARTSVWASCEIRRAPAEARRSLERPRRILDDDAARELRGGARRARRSAGRSGPGDRRLRHADPRMTLFGLQPNPSPDRPDVLVSLSRAQITIGARTVRWPQQRRRLRFGNRSTRPAAAAGCVAVARAGVHAAGRRDEAAKAWEGQRRSYQRRSNGPSARCSSKRSTTCVRHRRWGVAELRATHTNPRRPAGRGRAGRCFGNPANHSRKIRTTLTTIAGSRARG